MPTVKELKQTRAGGLHVSMDGRGEVTKEEAYFAFEFVWLGKFCRADVTADRYRASVWHENGDKARDELTPWRVIVRSYYDTPLTDAARHAAADLIEPIVRAWIASPEYVKNRQRAYALAIARAISEERFDAARANRVLEMHCDELTLDDFARLANACDLLRQLLAALKA